MTGAELTLEFYFRMLIAGGFIGAIWSLVMSIR